MTYYEIMEAVVTFGGALTNGNLWAIVFIGLFVVTFAIGLILKTRVVYLAILIVTMLSYWMLTEFSTYFSGDGAITQATIIIVVVAGLVLALAYSALAIFVLKFNKKNGDAAGPGKK